jgi:hypothetical protein
MSLILKTTTLTFGKNQLVRSSPFICRTPFSTLMMTEDEEEVIHDIEDLHFEALKQGSRTYIDSGTEFTVLTELAHLKRGTCCGNKCRHCPYGFENVRNGTKRPAKLRSGDFDTAQKMIQAIQEGKPITHTILSPPRQQLTRMSLIRAPGMVALLNLEPGRSVPKMIAISRRWVRSTSCVPLWVSYMPIWRIMLIMEICQNFCWMS